jgi:hypothetical protein
MAAACDRKLPGDPLWLLVISASGGTKTEIVRNLQGNEIYSLDSLTEHTLISGKIQTNEDGTSEPVGGILPQIDGKVVVIKDFTTILNKHREQRDEIFSQLRALYDGYIEYAFGNMKEPIRGHAKIGLIGACVPAILMYQKFYVILGERFLSVRHRPHRLNSAERALVNLGNENQMRDELSMLTEQFFKNIETKDIIEEPGMRQTILKIADAVAKLRTPVSMSIWQYDVKEAMTPSIEYPTRLAKQLLKLAKLLALVRGKDRVEQAELNIIKRVARDSCIPNRIKILEITEPNKAYKTREISEATNIPLTTCWREMKEMEYLGLCTYKEAQTNADSFGRQKHDAKEDGWTITDESLYTVKIVSCFTNVPPTGVRGNIIDHYSGGVVSETASSIEPCIP